MIIVATQRILASKRSQLMKIYMLDGCQASNLKELKEVDVIDDVGTKLINDGYACCITKTNPPFHQTEYEDEV